MNLICEITNLQLKRPTITPPRLGAPSPRSRSHSAPRPSHRDAKVLALRIIRHNVSDRGFNQIVADARATPLSGEYLAGGRDWSDCCSDIAPRRSLISPGSAARCRSKSPNDDVVLTAFIATLSVNPIERRHYLTSQRKLSL